MNVLARVMSSWGGVSSAESGGEEGVDAAEAPAPERTLILPPPPPPLPKDDFLPESERRRGPELSGAPRWTAMEREEVAATREVQEVSDDATTVNVAEAWTLLTQGYSQERSATGAAQVALEKAAGNPALQSKLIDLLQATPTATLEEALSRDFAAGVKAAVPNPPPRPPGITSVGTARVADSALEWVAMHGNPATLKPALDAAVSRGHLASADRDVLASCLGSAGAATQARLDGAVSQVHAAEQAYSAALVQREALEQRLASDIASFGPYLTEPQQRDYIQAFRTLHGSEYADFETKAQALDTALARNAPLLEQALRGPTGTASARALHAAYGALAQSSHADVALTWAAKMERPGSAFAPFKTALPLDTVHTKAMSGALVSYFETHPKATQAQAVDHLQSLLTNGYLAQQAGGAAVDLKVNDLPQAWRTGLQGLRLLANGKSAEGVGVLRGLESGSSKLAGPFAAAGLVLGLMQANQSAKSQDTLGRLWADAFSGQQFSSLASTALSAANKSGGALVAARVSGGFGVVASALDLFIQRNEILAGQGNVGTGLSIAGDVMGLAGGGLLALGATGVGAPLAAAGAAVYVIGELVSAGIVMREEIEREAQLHREQRTLLGKAGADVEQVLNLARYSSPEQVASIIESTGWSREQVLSLGKTFPEFFGGASALDQLARVGKDFGLTPDQRFAMLHAIARSATAGQKDNGTFLRQFADAVRDYPRNTVGISVPPGLSRKEQWVYFLRELGNRMGSYDGMGPRNAARYLETAAR
ncbi:hypothetical protein JGU66_04050 [Myxococcaceae bacterium JPH2]|nr:hypothetical protein [Myxococcaceae bacterium JPH2]